MGSGGAQMTRSDLQVSLPLAAWALWRREVVRFVRQRSRVVGALGTPLVFWLLIGSGFGTSVRTPGEGASHFLAYTFPGAIVLITLFTAIFSTISIVEDRQAGFLQGVLVSPAGASALVWGKLSGATCLGLVQGMLFLCLGPLSGLSLSVMTVAAGALVLIVLGLGLSALGFVIAWTLDSTQGFHAVMNLLLMPMWMLSGALFPPSGASGWIQWVIAANPLTYGVSALRHAIHAQEAAGAGGPTLAVSMAVSIVFTVLMIGLAVAVAARRD